MIAAYILVKLAPEADVAKVSHALKEPGIKGLDMTLGPWDAFVRCEAQDVAALGRLAQQVRACPGVSDTLTCPII
jgi:DNA-binding Lrp family transcriptional regulator